MLTINTERFLSLMTAQAQIGKTAEGGVSRPALSLPDIEVRAWFEAEIKARRLAYQVDGAGNQITRLPCASPDAKTLILASHLDSVPDGGRFDGALGVLVAFETMLTLKEAGVNLPFHVEAVNFTDEEGNLLGLFGSRAMTGAITPEALCAPRGGREQLLEGFARVGITDASVLGAKRSMDDIMGYLEVHIEQGTRLTDSGNDIGVVTSIVGIRSFELTFKGRAGHAGTTPMDKRQDAFRAAARFADQAHRAILDNFSPGVVNFGTIQVKPGAFNVIPDTAILGMEFRHGDLDTFNHMQQTLLALAEKVAESLNVTVTADALGDIRPSPMSDYFVDTVEKATESLNLKSTRLMSFAGHDAQSFSGLVDNVIYFVPSVNGVSHHPEELTTDEDCINAANVMLHAVLQLAQQTSP